MTENSQVALLPDVSDAQTYADALERARGARLSYKARLLSNSFAAWITAPRKIMIFFVSLYCMFPLILAFYSIFVYLFYGVSVLAFLFFIFSLVVQTRVSLRHGVISTRRPLAFHRKLDLDNAVWVGADRSRNYIYGQRGGIRLRLLNRRSVEQRSLMHLAFTLGKMKIRELSDNVVESGAEIPIPLSEGATHRRLLVIVPRLFYLIPLLFFLGFTLFMAVTDKKYYDWYNLPVLSVFVVAPFVIIAYWLTADWFRFFSAYGFRKVSFSPSGLRVGKEPPFPYPQIAIRLYRGHGNIGDAEPGMIEIKIPGRKSFFFGAEREHFFLLPYVLKKWAGNSFEILPMKDAPRGIERAQYGDIPGYRTRRERVLHSENNLHSHLNLK